MGSPAEYLCNSSDLGSQNEEVPEAAEDAANIIESAGEEGVFSDKDLPNNQIVVAKEIEASDNSPPPGERPEVVMRGRGPIRKYSQKTASFRWSGPEMIQIDGP